MVALHDANKYRGTLLVHKITREDVEAMAKAAGSRVTTPMVERLVATYLRSLGDDVTVVTPEMIDELETRAVRAIVKGFTKMLMFDVLQKRGFDTTQRTTHWDTIDEHGEWVSTTFCQGEDAIPVQ